MDDYPGEGPESGVGEVSSADLQSTIPDMRMTHANQLAAWTQAHEDGQYVTFASGSGSQGTVYDAQVTDIVQQAYLQSALVQSDSSADKFAVYQGPGAALDKSGAQPIEDAVNFSRSVEIDHRYDVMRPKGLEIVHAVSLDDVESVYRHVTKNGSEGLHVFEVNNHVVDPAKADAEKSGMTEYGRVLLKHQLSQYNNPLPSGIQVAPPPVHPSKSYGDATATKLLATSVTNTSDNLTGMPDVDLQEEVELFDHEWGDQTRLLLFNLMTEHKLCDAAISTGKFSIKLHKLVLAMSSERFASFLSSDNDMRAASVMVPLHISETTLKVFVTFLYLGKVKVSLEVVKEIKLLSMIFEIHNLEHLCYGIMVKHNLTACNGSWPKLKVTFVNSCSKCDQSVGTEECYFRAMSELAKPPQQRKSRGKTKKGQKRKVNPAIAGPKLQIPAKVSKSAPHRYGTRGALSTPDILELSARVDPERRKTEDQPIVKQGPKARFGRNAAKKIANRTADQDVEDCFEGFRPSPVLDFGEAGHSNGTQEDNTETEPSMQNVGSVPEQSSIRTLKGRKQKLLESVEMSRLREMNTVHNITAHPPGTISKSSVSEVSTGKFDNVPEVLCSKPATTFENSQTGVSGSLNLLPDETFAPNHHTTDTYTAVKKGKKGRAKKFPLPNQVAVRPPPKKRAKMELNRLNRDNDDDNDYELPMIFLSPSPSPAKDVENVPTVPRIAKPKPNKKKRWPKSDITSQLSSELERMAENIEDRERQYKCNLCGNEFVFPKRSVTHLLNTHKVPVDEVIRNVQIRRKEFSPKVCDICGYKTKDPNFYYIHYHKYFRHGTPLPKGWKPFTCDICGKECFTKFQLKDHKLVHQEDTPFVCEVCGTGFKSRTCFNSHVFHRHNLERKHACPDCQKTFKTKTQRLVHMRVHSGEKPFSCPDCPYKSTTRGNMRLHLCNKHKFDPERIKDIMLQLKTQEGAGSGQAMKMFLDPINYSQSAIVQTVPQNLDASMLSDSSLNVSDPSMQTDVPLTMTASSVALDRSVNVINAEQAIATEHAMHTILLPLAVSDGVSSAQTITTYAVDTSIPLTTIATETQTSVAPMSSSPDLSPPRQPPMAATTHFYMQHSPISPPPPSDSPQAPYANSANLQQCISPLNLQAAQVVTTTLTPVSLPPATTPTPDNTQNYEAGGGTNQQSYDTAMIQAYYQQQFYPHGY